jgi:uncharacterized membrane protein YfcA
LQKGIILTALVGAAAGAVNGLFGAGGGMILVPLLTLLGKLEQQEVFPASICIILPMCILTLTLEGGNLPWRDALPYLIGSGLGGIAAGIWGRKIPTLWLHRVLGALILWGGVRYLW